MKLKSQVRTLLANDRLNVHNFRYITGSVTTGSLVNTGNYTCINAVAQSTDETGRVGDLCKFHWLECSMSISTASAIQTVVNLRYLVVRETTTLGSAVTPQQFFAGVTSTPAPIALRNYATRDDKRYHVLYDSGSLPFGPETTPLAVAGSSFNTYLAPCSWEKVHKRIPLKFTTDYSRGTAGTVAHIDTNGVTLIVITDNTTANQIGFLFNYVWQYSC
jgi:hypothetical protein